MLVLETAGSLFVIRTKSLADALWLSTGRPGSDHRQPGQRMPLLRNFAASGRSVPRAGVRGFCMPLLCNSIAERSRCISVATRRQVIASDVIRGNDVNRGRRVATRQHVKAADAALGQLAAGPRWANVKRGYGVSAEAEKMHAKRVK